jgi:hypothetical protein
MTFRELLDAAETISRIVVSTILTASGVSVGLGTDLGYPMWLFMVLAMAVLPSPSRSE